MQNYGGPSNMGQMGSAKYRTLIVSVLKIQGDQKVSVDLMITIQKAAAQRLFDHPVQTSSHQAPQ